ncbi:kinase-like domain-containing protein [Panaeolus papilionaceus]|nr:kinase-like domain-containing protein [Panaeolus papilionaceus]
MDVIESCLGIAPVPGLGFAFKVFKSIFASVQEAQGFKEQLIVLSASIAAILKALDRQYRDGKLSEISTRKELDELNELMREISTFTQKQSAYNFLKLMFVKELALSTIDGYRSRLDATVNAFQIAALVNIQHWQTKNDKARISDRAALHARLAQMESNQKLLIEALSIQHSSELALMTTLQRRIKDKAPNADPKELEFFSHSLRYLETKTGATVDIQDWTIGPFDVEFGPELGSGGFGRVCKARWNQMDVAVKVMKNSEKISPNAEAIRREVDIWSKLNHPHILQFLGANILDDDPFIVMPLVPNGNIRSFIRKHPNSDRLKFIYHISLGLVYLHSKGVVHGDLKGVNVLIGDGEKALLCDFGLSRIKADVNSRSSAESTAVVGSQNWMAPELFQGGRPKAPSDMYSFGMTIYEIYTDEIPLGHLHPATLREVVVNINTRPDRPDETEAPTLTDDVWRLATECWAANPSFRPAAPIICDRLQKLYSSTQGHPAPELNPDARTQLRLTTAPQSPIQTYPDHPHISPQNPNNDPRNVPAENPLPHISPVKKRNLAGRIFGMHKGNPSTATLPPYSHHEQDPSAQPHPPQATRPVPAQEAIPIDRRNTQPGYTPVVLEPPPLEPRRNPPADMPTLSPQQITHQPH